MINQLLCITFPIGSSLRMSFINTKEFETVSTKSIRSLKAVHSKQTTSSNPNLYVIINTESPLLDKKDYVHRIIPIPHTFNKDFIEKKILILTKSNTNLNNYVELLRPLTTKYENIELMSIKKLKKLGAKSLTRLYNDYDYVVCDYRIQLLLPDILGVTFYGKNKRIPFIIQLFKETVEQMEQKKKGIISKEEVDLKYVIKQIKSIVSNTSFLLSPDSNITIKFGEVSQPTAELYKNLEQILKFLADSSNQKITNWNSKRNSIKSVLIKTTESASLPLYKRE